MTATDSPEPALLRAARYFTFGSAVSILISIAVSQILLALALAALLMSGARLRLPPIWLPLGLFLTGTLISLALSDHPAAGLPQVRKIFVYLMLLVVFSTIRDLVIIRRLFLCWAVLGALVAVRGLIQFANKLHQAHALGKNFYDFYVVERITGFMSHWMTFGGEEMFVLLMVLAYVLFACRSSKPGAWFWALCGSILAIALTLGFTRSIWMATAVAGLYLVWFRKRVLVLLVPVLLLAGAYVAPYSVRTRVVSMVQPRKDIDSNQHRIITWRTGLRMIQAHPWFGVGPEHVKLQFYDYLPADISQPLPPGWYGHLHNIYLHYAAERGVPVMLALLCMLGKILLDYRRALTKLGGGRSDERFLLHGGVAVVIATMIGGFFELNLGDSEVLTMFLVVVACGYVAVERARVTVPEVAQEELR